MKFLSAFIHISNDGELKAKATIEVEGIGEVNFDHAMSVELCEALAKEAIVALRVKLGQRINDTER